MATNVMENKPANSRRIADKSRKEQPERSAGSGRLWGTMLAGSAVMWIALPPCGLALLAYVALVPWLLLVRRESLTGRRPYRAIYLAGWLHWMLLIQWIRMPHWTAAWGGWPALAAYLGIFVPLFIGLARTAVHRLRIPLVFAAPVIWTGLEYLRGYAFSGFPMVMLSHTVYRWPICLQVADLAGEFLVSLVLVTASAAVASAIPVGGRRQLWPLLVGAAVVGGQLIYGSLRLAERIPGNDGPRSLPVAVIQGDLDTVFDDSEFNQQRIGETFNDHVIRTREVVELHPETRLVIWAESMLNPVRPLTHDDPLPVPPELPADRAAKYRSEKLEELTQLADIHETLMWTINRRLPKSEAQPGPVYLLSGTSAEHLGSAGMEWYNSAVLFDPEGKIRARYDKMHLVPFGEFIPGGQWFPQVYALTPLGGGLNTGKKAIAIELDGVRLSPSICFESTVPRVIRSHCRQLAAEGTPADVLVNVTNDGWFWSSSEQDMHLACGVLRTVECRKPMVIAANTGFSAVIDGNGVIQQQAPRHERFHLVTTVRPDERESLYLSTVGDWPWWFAVAGCVLCGIVGCRGAKKKEDAAGLSAERA